MLPVKIDFKVARSGYLSVLLDETWLSFEEYARIGSQQKNLVT